MREKSQELDRWNKCARRGQPLTAALILAATIASYSAYAVVSMQPDYRDASAGFVTADPCPIDCRSFRGSGVVAQDPRLVFTAVHVLFENGRWATNIRFSRAWNNRTEPGPDDGVQARGFRSWSGYADRARRNEISPESFHFDFAVLFNNAGFGPSVGFWPNGGAQLASARWKVCRGYPAEVVSTGQPGYALQHATPFFQDMGWRAYGSYYQIVGVAAGGGASGGPCYVFDPASSDWYLAGQLVSGSEIGPSIGVRALDADTKQLADTTLGVEPVTVTKSFANRRSVVLPDDGWWVGRHIQVSDHPGRIQGLVANVNISTTWRGDLMVVLRSPTRRVRWLTNRQGSNAQDFSRTFRLAPRYQGLPAEGDWALVMRDAAAGDRAVFHSVSLRVTNRL